MTLRELHLFAGIGGGVLGGLLLGHRCVGAVELDPYCRRVLEARQRDGILEPFPIHDDIRTFDGGPWRGRVDVIAGGFPCQDVSLAGRGEGLAGSRSGLWFEMARVVREVEPRYVFVENVPGLLVRGFDRILGTLAELGFDAEWCVRSAADVGAPHLRKRIWILAAHPDRQQHEGSAHAIGRPGAQELLADTNGWRQQCERLAEPGRLEGARGDLADRCGAVRQQQHETAGDGLWATEPNVGRVASGIPARVDRLRALGNAQVPLQAAEAFAELMARFAEASA